MPERNVSSSTMSTFCLTSAIKVGLISCYAQYLFHCSGTLQCFQQTVLCQRDHLLIMSRFPYAVEREPGDDKLLHFVGVLQDLGDRDAADVACVPASHASHPLVEHDVVLIDAAFLFVARGDIG